MTRTQTNFYAGSRFNRLSERRGDAAWLQAAYEHERTLLLPVWQGRSWLAGTPPIHVGTPRRQLPHALEWFAGSIFIGEFNAQYCFAVDLSEVAPPAQLTEGEFVDLRQVGGQLPRDEAGLLAYARAMVQWQRNHRYCGSCGAATEVTQAGHVLRCTQASCGRSHFPRLDPAIIVLVTDGPQVLLGRKADWPTDRYSTLAGFMEWGESVEEAVAREVYEETGVTIGEVRYHSSQPWPFPSSLMLGFLAQAQAHKVRLLDGELADARWFSRAQLFDGTIRLPPAHALSYQLLATWYDLESGHHFGEQVLRQSQLDKRS